MAKTLYHYSPKDYESGQLITQETDHYGRLTGPQRAAEDWRSRSIGTARLSFNAALPREGRIARQSRRCFLARQGVASLRELREWCYPSQERRHWHRTNIYRALRKLGAKRIGWGMYAL